MDAAMRGLRGGLIAAVRALGAAACAVGCAAAASTPPPAQAPPAASAAAPSPSGLPASDAAASLPPTADRFYDEGAGVQVRKLPSWVFMTLEAEVANRRAVSVGNEKTDAMMHDGTTPPLVVIARYPEPSEKPNPTLKISLRPLGELGGASAVKVASIVAEVMRRAIPSFSLDGDVGAARVSGLDAGTFRAHFTVDVPHLGRSFVVKTQAWIVPRGSDGFIIAASDPTNGAENYEPDFQAMVKTIVIRK